MVFICLYFMIAVIFIIWDRQYKSKEQGRTFTIGDIIFDFYFWPVIVIILGIYWLVSKEI